MNIEDVISDGRLFVDTCSLMHESSEHFFLQILDPALTKKKAKVIVPEKVIKEVERLQNHRNADTQKSARRGARILNQYKEKGFLDVRGEEGDPFADNVFHYVFSKFRTRYNLALLTQDVELARDIKALGQSQAIRSDKQVLVLKISPAGELREWNFNAPGTPQARSPVRKTADIPPPPVKFRLCTDPYTAKDRLIPVKKIPVQGDSVIADGLGQLRLTRLLGCGGEGSIFLTDSGQACKIYLKDRITELRQRKITLMAGAPICMEGICWPLALARNLQGDFVGYIMPIGQGKPMQKCMFIKPLLEKNFPHWRRIHLVQLASVWLERIIALHDRNVLVGDINPLNFLVESESRIFFVDTDSYQIEDFPCPVGMANFTAPEIQGKDFSTFLRTSEHESFSLTTLLFMILMPGKPPYSQQGGGDPISNIKNGDFSYPLGGKTNKKTPDGPWRFIWSHFPYRTKRAFHDCFAEGKRVSATEWLEIMKDYRYRLEKGHLDSSGESDKVFPSKFKSVSRHAQETYGAQSTVLLDFRCDFCGKSFQVDETRAAKIRSFPKKACRDCASALKSKNETGEMKVCEACGHQFLFSAGEQEYFERNALFPPKKCPDCRHGGPQHGSRSSPKPRRPTVAVPERGLWDELKDFWTSFWS